MIRLSRGDFGFPMVENLDGAGAVRDTLLVQTDWDYPGIAESFGWSLRSVIRARRDSFGTFCDHSETDGTVSCSCGLRATDFIAAAADWLADHIGATADDPGYFGD